MKGNKFTRVLSVILALVLALVLLVYITSCGQKEEANEKMRVVVSIVPLADFAKNVGGEKIDVTVMVPPGASPHTYEPTPTQMVELSEAEAYIKVGSGVEFEIVWMDKLIDQNPDMLVIDCSKDVALMGKDPHIWLSPKNAQKMVGNICNGLIEVDPENKHYYIQNMTTYFDNLDDLDTDIKNGLLGVENRTFMVYHPAFGYFARDYDLTMIPIAKEGKEPTAEGLAKLIEQAKANNIKLVFASPQFNVENARTIAQEIGGRVAFIDPLAVDYINNMYMVLDELVKGME